MTSVAHAEKVPALAPYAVALTLALQEVTDATRAAWSTGVPGDALVNAVPYMQAFGHTVLAWIWLDVALAALQLDANQSMASTLGRLGATRYFYHYELPKIDAWMKVVASRDPTCADLPVSCWVV